MKNQLTKEHALKALLLVALAGNQAISIAGQATEAELASTGETVSSATGVNSVSQSPLSLSPNAMTLQHAAKPQVDRVPIVNRGSSRTTVATAKKYTGKIRLCEVPLHVLFEEITEGGQKKTRITLSEVDAKEGKFTTAFSLIGTPAELGISPDAPNEKAKQEIDGIISQTGRRELEKASRCGADEEIEVATDEERRPAPRIARSARRNRGGGKSVEVIRRSISRISGYGDVNDENEARGRARNERELEKLIKSEVYPSLKAMLMGRDARAEEGLSLLDDAIEALEALGTEGLIDNRRILRLSGTLKGLKYGAETYHRVQEFSEEARALKEDFQNARGQGGQILPEQYQQYQELQSRMQQEIVMGPFAQLSQYRAYMSAADLKAFTQPYQSLQSEMQLIVGGPGLGGGVGPGLPGGLPGQIANVPSAFPNALPGQFGGGVPGQIANVPGALGPPIQMNQLGGGFNPGLVANSPFNNPSLVNPGLRIGAPIPAPSIGGVPGLGGPQPILGQPPFAQSGIVANVPSPILGGPIAGSPIFPNAPNLTIGSPIVPAPVTPFTAGIPTINRAPLVATNSFGYGSPSPFLMTQPSLFSSTVAQPQIYANTLPAQAVVSPATGLGSLGAYANFSLNFGAPSVFATPVGPYYR